MVQLSLFAFAKAPDSDSSESGTVDEGTERAFIEREERGVNCIKRHLQ